MTARKTRARGERGQAMVELALGSLVLVTVLMASLYFAEFGFMWVKLEEAANFALFDATNRQVHDIEAGTWNAMSGRYALLGDEAKSRYEDFDGLSSVSGRTTLSQVFARGTAVDVTCQKLTGAPNIDVAGAGAAANKPFGAAATENTAISCQASATIAGFRIPKKYADGSDGFFDSPVIAAKDATNGSGDVSIGTCAAGRGDCKSHGFGMLLDDWGLQGASEAGECKLTSSENSCANAGYYKLGELAYQGAGGSDGNAGSQFATDIAGFTPTTEAPFWMSFRGEESDFTETHPSDGSTDWPTTPYNDPSSVATYKTLGFDQNGNCFLGSKCS